MRYLIDLFPLRYFIEVTFGILLRGADLDVLWDLILVMVLLGSVLFGLGLWHLCRQPD